MAQIVVSKTYVDGDALFESDLDNLRESLEYFLNVTQVNDDNIQSASITASDKFIDGTVTGSNLAAAVVDDSTIQLSSSQLSLKDAGITTAKLAASAVTTAKINDLAVTTAKFASGAVTDAKLVDDSITRAKFGHSFANVTTSSSSSTFSTTSTTYTAVTNLSAAITTTKGNVLVSLQPDGSGAMYGGTVAASTMSVKILRDSTTIHESTLAQNIDFLGGILIVDNPSTGSYTYTVEVKSSDGGIVYCQYAVLRVKEVF